MGEQGPKTSSRAEQRGLTRNAEDDRFDAPEPTHSEARARRPDNRLDERREADADTKIERRASVRPSAFGAPRKSIPPAPAALEGNSTSVAAPAREQGQRSARHEPHERVLEAARLLDAVAPALLDDAAAPDLEDAPRLANQRARGVEHLIARGNGEYGSRAEAATSTPWPTRTSSQHDLRASVSSPAEARASVSSPAEARASVSSPAEARASVSSRAEARGSTVPGSAAEALGARPTPSAQTKAGASLAEYARVLRRPGLSLVLFGGMIALSIVPLLRYAQSSDKTPSGRAALPRARASVAALSPVARTPEPSTAPVARESAAAARVGREQVIASLLSEGNHALDAKDIREAERIFGHVLELAEDNPHAAHGLARIRLSQNNLSGAEGWIQLALRKRPRRAAYHALYAEVLSRMGRGNEAREELARAGVGRDGEAP